VGGVNVPAVTERASAVEIDMCFWATLIFLVAMLLAAMLFYPYYNALSYYPGIVMAVVLLLFLLLWYLAWLPAWYYPPA
jgi:hypothetical protein